MPDYLSYYQELVKMFSTIKARLDDDLFGWSIAGNNEYEKMVFRNVEVDLYVLLLNESIHKYSRK